MNLILVKPDEVRPNGVVHLAASDRRSQHITGIHRAQKGDFLRAGVLGDLMGHAEVLSLHESGIELRLQVDTPPPAPIALTLFLALPRPKFLRRCLLDATTLGVKEIYLFNSYRVDKAYWSCAQIEPEQMREACILGLEQAEDTILPNIHLERLFKPFAEDRLPELIKDHRALLAHPGAEALCPFDVKERVALAIGPEGGFIPFEIALLEKAGFHTVRTFERILKVECAISSLVGRLK